MPKLLVDIPEDLITSFNEMADLSKKSTNELIVDILKKLVHEYREYRVALDRLNDDSGIYRDPPPQANHFLKITIFPSFKITEI